MKPSTQPIDGSKAPARVWATRVVLATGLAGLGGLSLALAALHASPTPSEPVANELADVPSLAQAQAAGIAAQALLLDLVDPQEGEGSSESELQDFAASLGATTLGAESQAEHVFRWQGSPTELEQLAERLGSDPRVEGLEPELVYSIPDDAMVPVAMSEVDEQRGRDPLWPNDPLFHLQWHLNQIHSPQAWAHSRGEGAVVAVIDTGVAWKDLEWKDIRAKAVPDLAGVPIVHPKTFVSRSLPDGLDDHAHGTHVAGTIAQATNNGVGVAGVAHRASIMPLKVLAGSGRGSTGDIANAVRYAADNGAHVINMSLGGPLNSKVLAKAVKYARDKGTTVVCAAGNSGRGRVDYPGANDGCFAVAALTTEGQRSFYSNWGEKLDIAAPGGDTRADRNGDGFPDGVLQNTIKIQTPDQNDYLWFMGTSMAAPHVAGVAALVAAQGVTRPDEVERILQETAVHPNKVKWDAEFGAGRVDAHAAVVAARSNYDGERTGVLALLGLTILAALGLPGAGLLGVLRALGTLRVATMGIGASVAAVGWGQPLAYQVAQWSGLGLSSGLLLSVLPPLFLALAFLQRRRWLGAIAGLSLGWAALLAHGAVVLPTVLGAVPGGMAWDRVYLAGQALLCVGLTWRLLRLATNAGDRSVAASASQA